MPDAPKSQLSPLSAKTIFDIIADVRDVFVRTGVFDSAGNFTDLHGSEIARAAAEIETLLRGHGLTVPPNFDKIIQAAPIVLGLVGVQ